MGGGGQIISKELKDNVKRMAGEEERKKKRKACLTRLAACDLLGSYAHVSAECFPLGGLLHMECHSVLTC